jgi:hypothetical protein
VKLIESKMALKNQQHLKKNCDEFVLVQNKAPKKYKA